MTTQTLTQAISLRNQLSLEELIQFAPQIADVVGRPAGSRSATAETSRASAESRRKSDAEYAFWSTFTFGCIQAVILFWLIYSYFAD